MALSIPVFALFALYERHKTRQDGSPLVELSLFRQRAFVGGMLTNLIFFAGISSFFLVFVLYLQVGLGFTPLQAGLAGLPFSVGAMIASGVSIQLAPKLGRRVIQLGCLVIAAGMAGLILTVNIAGTGITGWLLLPSLFVCGLGLGLVAAPLADIILAGISERDAGSASGVFNTANQIGGALGVAIIGVIFFGLPQARPRQA